MHWTFSNRERRLWYWYRCELWCCFIPSWYECIRNLEQRIAKLETPYQLLLLLFSKGEQLELVQTSQLAPTLPQGQAWLVGNIHLTWIPPLWFGWIIVGTLHQISDLKVCKIRFLSYNLCSPPNAFLPIICLAMCMSSQHKKIYSWMQFYIWTSVLYIFT